MPRYYFDVADETGSISDEEGTDLLAPLDVHAAALGMLLDLAKGSASNRLDRLVAVRNEDGGHVFIGHLSLTGWSLPKAQPDLHADSRESTGMSQ